MRQVRLQLGLAQSEAHWQAHKKRLSANKLSGMLTQIKAEESTAWLNDVSSVVLQQSLRHLKKAYEKFFKKTAKKPRFKKKQNEQSASYMDNAFARAGQSFTLAKQKEPLQIRWSRPLPEDARVSSLTVTSKLCSACGHKLDDLPLKARAWTCPACSAEHDRDQNAARNLLSVALGSLSDGSDATDQPVPRGTREFTSVRHLGAT